MIVRELIERLQKVDQDSVVKAELDKCDALVFSFRETMHYVPATRNPYKVVLLELE